MLTGLGLDVGSGCLFCAECNNFIFNETIEQVYTSCILYTEEKTTRFQGTSRASKFLWHLRFSQYPKCSDNHILFGFQMNKKPQLLKVLPRFPVKVRSRTLGFLSESPQNHIPGRRGLLNLGQTCFMNVVLQCLIHNPLVRNYFLGDKHNRRQCKTDNCTCCEMDRLLEEVNT